MSTAFTAGLLHDIGKTVINRVLTPKTRADIRAKIAAESLSRVQAEKAVLGANHSEVGACLLRKWLLPEPIVEAVANHHTPVTEPVVRLSAVVYLANSAAHIGGATFGWEARLAEAGQAVRRRAEDGLESGGGNSLRHPGSRAIRSGIQGRLRLKPGPVRRSDQTSY